MLFAIKVSFCLFGDLTGRVILSLLGDNTVFLARDEETQVVIKEFFNCISKWFVAHSDLVTVS